MKICDTCQGAIMEPGQVYGYAGPLCVCGWAGINNHFRAALNERAEAISKAKETERLASRVLRDWLEEVCFPPSGDDRVADGRIPLALFEAVDAARAKVDELLDTITEDKLDYMGAQLKNALRLTKPKKRRKTK